MIFTKCKRLAGILKRTKQILLITIMIEEGMKDTKDMKQKQKGQQQKELSIKNKKLNEIYKRLIINVTISNSKNDIIVIGLEKEAELQRST